MWARKLGLPTDGARSLERAAQLWTGCRRLLASHPTDYTIFWRQLADLATAVEDASVATDAALLAPLIPIAFYKPLHEATRREWARWLRWWLTELNAVHGARPETRHSIAEGMRRASPKYIPREWMLAEAYEAAERGDYAAVRTLHDVLRRPYDEQPEVASRFFQRAPDGSDVQGGIGFRADRAKHPASRCSVRRDWAFHLTRLFNHLGPQRNAAWPTMMRVNANGPPLLLPPRRTWYSSKRTTLSGRDAVPPSSAPAPAAHVSRGAPILALCPGRAVAPQPGGSLQMHRR